MKLGFRTKMQIYRATSFWLFRQLRQQGWPFNRLKGIDEALREGLIDHYSHKFSSKPIDSSIRPIHLARAEVELYCQQFEQIAPSVLPEVGVAELADVLVDMPTCVHRCSDRMLRNGVIDIGLLTNIKYLNAFVTAPLRPKQKLPGGVLLGLPYLKNYYHWLIEILPRIQLIENDSRYANQPWFLPAECPRFVRTMIEVAGYSDRVRYLERGIYRFERLAIPTAMSVSEGASHPNEINWLRKTFLADTRDRPTRRLLISRSDSPQRFLVNESEALERLAPLGFELIQPGKLDFASQVKIFSEAQIVVGPHGAAFANIAFCSVNTGLIEIFASNHVNFSYSQIAKIRQMTYGVVVGEPSGLGISVNLDELEETVQRVISAVELLKTKGVLMSLND